MSPSGREAVKLVWSGIAVIFDRHDFLSRSQLFTPQHVGRTTTKSSLNRKKSNAFANKNNSAKGMSDADTKILTPHANYCRLRSQDSSMGSGSWVDWVAGVLCIGFWAGFGFYGLSCMWIFYTLLFSQERKLMLLSFQGTEVFVVVLIDLSHRGTLLLEVILTLLISRFHLQPCSLPAQTKKWSRY
jgi:hypothetical protein